MLGPEDLKLSAIDCKNGEEVDFLYQFIFDHHSTPKNLLPTKEELNSPSLFFFRAVLDEKLIGMSSYYKVTPFLAETQKTIVLPEFRGKGFGKKISSLMEDLIKNRGFKKIRSAIYIQNLKMLKIKLDQSYIIEGLLSDHDAPGLHEYSLGKILG